jgi:hypothetical protein
MAALFQADGIHDPMFLFQPAGTGFVLVDSPGDMTQSFRAMASRVWVVSSKEVVLVIGIIIVARTSEPNPRKLIRPGRFRACNNQWNCQNKRAERMFERPHMRFAARKHTA